MDVYLVSQVRDCGYTAVMNVYTSRALAEVAVERHYQNEVERIKGHGMAESLLNEDGKPKLVSFHIRTLPLLNILRD